MRLNKKFLDQIGNNKIKEQLLKEFEKKPRKAIKLSTDKVNGVYLQSNYNEYKINNYMDSNQLLLIIPMPAPELSPNKTLHWSKKYDYKKQAKITGYETVLSLRTNNNKLFNIDKKFIECQLFVYSNRKIDDDNLEASLKSIRDGIYMGLNLDDNLQIKTTRETYYDKSNIIILYLTTIDEHIKIDISCKIKELLKK